MMNRKIKNIIEAVKIIFINSRQGSINKTKPNLTKEYSPYLVLVKPLIDVSKRAQVKELVSKDPLFQSVLAEIYDFKLRQGLIHSIDQLECDQDILRWQNEVSMFYRDSLRKYQLDIIKNNSDFKHCVEASLRSKGYEITQLHEDLFIASINGFNSVVKVALNSTFDKFHDVSWDQESLVNLAKIKHQYNCSAAIYVTPGVTSKVFRKQEKASDVFVVCGFELIQLFKETSLLSQYSLKAA
jgi:hypothetical protein